MNTTLHAPGSSAAKAIAVARDTFAIFNQSRNGTDEYIRHPLARRLIYTSGVQEVVETAGAYWLLDIIGTECTPKLLRAFEADVASTAIVSVKVEGTKAVLTMTYADDTPPVWTKRIAYTDFPVGEWLMYLACDSLVDPARMCTVLCLLTER